MQSKTKGRILIVGVLLVAMLFAVASGDSGSGSGSRKKTETCGVCHKTFEQGSSDYDSIVRRNMCNSCYKNYEWGMNAQGKDVMGNPLK